MEKDNMDKLQDIAGDKISLFKDVNGNTALHMMVKNLIHG
jgi:hypothetical protein